MYMTFTDHLLFLGCVALATYAQTTTGFAFGLILLGLAGVLSLTSLSDMANVVNMLALVNALVSLRGIKANANWSLIWPSLLASSVGIALGVVVLNWVSGSAIVFLSGLLGVTIVACAMLLIARKRPLQQLSSPRSFVSFGLLSGVLGGLFSTSGPPMVYHMYRQPLALGVIRDTLLVFFAVNSGLRITLVGASGGLNMSSVWLAIEAFPVVVFFTWLVRRYASSDSLQKVKLLVFALLMMAGLGLLIPALRTLFF